MQYKIIDESPWQILSNAMTIGPSSTGYQLQVAADGRNYTTLFTVGAGITRQITNLSSGSYFRMKGNEGEVTVNWVRDCSGGGGGTTYTAGEYINIDQDIISVTGITPDLYLTTADTQDFATQADITAATSPIEEHLNDVEYVTATALTELHDAILEISGSTGSSPIIPAITSQTDYEAISGSVKTGDLIQVQGVDINGDGGEAYGLFQAEVDQGSDSISWERKDNADSLMRADKMYPWMAENHVWPVDFGEGNFLISTDDNSEDEAYNGIGFDADGKPVTTHIVPQYDEQTGEITGITREDANIVKSTSVSTIWRGTQAEYDAITTPDASTLYIITNS